MSRRIALKGLTSGMTLSSRDHQQERQHTDDRDPDNKGRAEPVVLEPAVEHELERTEKGRDEREAGNVEPLVQPDRSAVTGFAGVLLQGGVDPKKRRPPGPSRGFAPAPKAVPQGKHAPPFCILLVGVPAR